MDTRKRSGSSRIIAALLLGLLLLAGVYLFLASPAFPGYSTLDYLLYLAQYYGVLTPNISISVLNNPFTITALKVAGVFLLAVTVMRLIQWPIIFWLDQRMINKIEHEIAIAGQTTWLSRFMARLTPEDDPGEAEMLPSGIYETKPGERFLDLFFPDWFWVTLYNGVIKKLVGPLVAVWLLLTITALTGVKIAFLSPSLILLLTGIVVAITYISQEWRRTNDIWNVFDQTYVGFKAEGSVPGLVFGAGADIVQRETEARLPKEIDMAVRPSALSSEHVPEETLVSGFDELVLEFLYRSRGVMTVAVRSFFQHAEDFLEFFPRITRMRETMNNAVAQGEETLTYLETIRKEAAKMMAPPEDPNRPWSYNEARRKAKAYVARATAPLPQPRLFNLLALKWRKLGRPVNGTALDQASVSGSQPKLPSARAEFHVADEESSVKTPTTEKQPVHSVSPEPKPTDTRDPNKIRRRQTRG